MFPSADQCLQIRVAELQNGTFRGHVPITLLALRRYVQGRRTHRDKTKELARTVCYALCLCSLQSAGVVQLMGP